MSDERERLVELVRRILAGDYRGDAGVDAAVSEFAASVPHPRASALIFYWDKEFDHEPSAEEIVDRALTYRPVDL